MKILSAETHPQGSAMWVKARLGKPTASEFHRIVTGTGKLSSQADKYAYRLLAESLMRQPMQDLEGLEWIERGKEMEPKAVMAYEFEREAKTQEVGFISTDDSEMGCSPDRIADSRRGLELKCPSPQVHIQYMIEGPGDKYRPQVQGSLMITEWNEWDFMSFHPYFPRVLINTPRDEGYISIMRKALKEFVCLKNEMMEKILAQGFIYRPDEILDVVEKELKPRADFDPELYAM